MLPDVIERVALLGWTVYPRAAKHRAAAFEGASAVATSDLDTLAQWAREYPDCGWYAVTGPSRIFALDVDAPPKKDGIAALQALTAKHGPIPERPMIRTGGGGYALIFAHAGEPLRGCSGLPAPGLDPRRGAQTITLPPTLHHATGRTYRWITPPWELTPPPAPKWLTALLAPLPEPPLPPVPYTVTPERAHRALYRAVDRIRTTGEGGRNDTLNRSAFHIGTLIAAGHLTRTEAENTLLHAAMQAGLARFEATATLRSAFRAAQRFPAT